MSAFDARKNVLERLRERENKRDWSELDKSSPPAAPNATRRWSAESYQVNNFIPLRKTPSPRRLPTLETRPASVDCSYHQDLNNQYQTVIPLLSHSKQKGEFGRSEVLYYQPRDPGQRAKDIRNECKKAQRGNVDMNRPPYPPLPSDSIHPKMAPHPHFPVMHPVPMIPVYPGYAPWFMPQFGLPGAVDPLDAQNGYYASGHTARLARPVRNISRAKAAVILQKYTRGWLVRKSQRFASWHYMCNKKHARRYIDSLIDSFLREEIIPDILIDVLSHKSFLSVKDPRYKAAELVCFEIIHQDLTDFINETAIGIFCSLVNSRHSKADSLLKVHDDIVNEVIKEAANDVVGSTIEEVVASHMTLNKTSDWLEDFILEMILPVVTVVAKEAIWEYKYESVVNEIIDEVTRPQLREAVVGAWTDVAEIDRNKQLQKLRSYAVDHVLDALCLQHLLSQFTGENLSLYFRDYMDQVLDGVTCGLLSQQYLAIEATQSNGVVKTLHENVFCDVALDVLVEELTGHLDEDIQDLTECEKQQSVFEL